MTIVKTEKS